MTCAITRPDPATLYNFFSNAFSTDVLGGAPIAPETTEWYVVNNQYLGSEWFFSIAEQSLAQTRPEEMCDDNLAAYFARYGIFPLAAQFARGYVRITGVVGTTIPSNLGVTLNGVQYVLDSLSTPPSVIGSDGAALVMMQAVVPGAVGNSTGSSGLLTDSVTGIDDAVTVYGSQFCAGADAETPSAFRQRALARLASVPNDDWGWMQRTAQLWPCVTRICRRRSNCCETGRIEAYAFFDGTFANGLAPQSVLTDMNKWLFGTHPGAGEGQARIGLFGKIFTAAPYPVDIRVDNLSGVSIAQWNEIKTQFAAIFNNRCPGEVLCKKWFEAIVTGVSIMSCDFRITLSAQNNPNLTCDGDISPGVDNLVVLGNIVGGPDATCAGGV